MQKKSTSELGIFNPRIFLAFVLCSIAVFLGVFSFASTPSSGTLSPATPVVTYSAGPLNVPNQSPVGLGQLDTGPRCNAQFPCDSFGLTVSLPVGYAAAHPNAAVKIILSWSDTGTGQSDYDLYVYNGNNPTVDGNHPADHQSASGSNPEVAVVNPLLDGNTQYTIKIVPFQPTQEILSIRIELLPGSGGVFPGFGGADPTTAGIPRYQIFAAPEGSSAEAGSGEFNIGFSPLTHRIMVMNSGPIWRLTPAEVQVPVKPECCEALWEDKSATTTNTGLDPILWTDQKSGRTFASNNTSGANFVYAYTDAAAPFNDGDLWVELAAAPPNGGADHETIGSGPYPLVNGLPNPLSTAANQGEAVYYCSQDIVGPAACQRSDNLGAAYGPGVPAYFGNSVTGCHGLHGHLHVAPDGTAWLPVPQCVGVQGGARSTDSGVTWQEFHVTGSLPQTQGADPSIAIDSVNTVYYAYVNNEPVGGGDPPEGHARVKVSLDHGATWIRPFDLGASHGIKNAVEIEAVGGSAGRAAVGFLGTDVNGDYQAIGFPGKWYAFIATTYDGGVTWTTVNATPNDPVQNLSGVWQGGGSHQDRNLLDFNEITVDDKGRVLYGYSDGCVTVGCISGGAPNNFTAHMRVARQFGGKPLLSQFDPNPVEPSVPKPACLSGTRDCTASHLSWKTPDNGGADIVNYQIFRGVSPGTEALIGQTGVPRNSFNDTSADPSVPHYFYVVKAISGTGTGLSSNEVDLAAGVVAVDDVATTSENQPVIIAVLANDCGSAPLSVTVVGAPSHGAVHTNGNGTVTYAPFIGFFGYDSFAYTLQNGQAATDTGTVRVTVNPICPTLPTGSFNDDLEPGPEPGWVVDTAENNLGPASPTWSVMTDPHAQSATHSFFSDATTLDVKDDRLVAPAQKLSSSSQLTFWHRFNFENGYDGGVLEVSSDGGVTWVDVLLGGGNFVSGGYNSGISASFGSRIAGRQAWTGGSPTAANDPMTLVVVNLGPFSGLDRLVRFRLVTDPLSPGALPGQGWWIDNVQFTNTLVEGPCGPTPNPTTTPTATPSGTPAPTATATSTGSPSGTPTPTPTPTPPPPCLNSATVVLTDPAGDQGVGNPAQSDILSVTAFEDYTYINSDRIVFILKVNSNLATIPADQIWNVIWTFGGTTYYVAMRSDDNSVVSYDYGTIANNLVTTLGGLEAGSYDNQGNIRLAIAGSKVGSPPVGAVLTAINGDTQLNVGGTLFTDEDTTSNGTYTIRAKSGACTPIPLPTPGNATYIHGGMSFSPNYTTRAPYIGQDVEPSVRCDKFGNCYVAAIRGVPGGTDLWYFDLRPTVSGSPNPNYDPFMRNPQYRGQPDRIAPVACINDPIPCGGTVGGDGGGDVDIAVGFNSEALEDPSVPPTLAYSSLAIANVSTQRSTNRGTMFLQNPGGSITGGVPVDDRQWLEFFGPNTVYLFYRTLEPAISQIQRSTDGGLTYGLAATAGAVGQAGGIAVDQNDGTVYISGSNGSVSVGIPPAAGLPPLVYTTHDVAGSGNSHLFFTVKVAADSTVYACYSNDHNVFVRFSTDKGNTWSQEIRVSDGPETLTAVFPWMTTGPVPGTIGVVWYGSNKLSTMDDTANWHVFYALGINLKANPTFRQEEASDHVNHGANISENGLDPTGTNPPNRNLADYFQVAFDPTGAAVIGYCGDHNDLSGHTFVTRQISGPGATGAGIPAPVEGSALPAPPNEPLPRVVDVGGIPNSQVTDYRDDVRLGGNPELGGVAVLPVDDPIDILSVLYSAEPTSAINPSPVLVVRMKVSDMTVIPPSSNWRMTFTANAPNSILSPTYEYSFGLSDRGDQFFVQAITDAAGSQTFVYGKAQRNYDGTITYTNLGAADCGFFDQTAKIITLKVALSKFNVALPSGHTPIAPGSNLVGLRGSAFTTAGSGASGSNKADTTRGGTQFLVAVGPLTPCGVQVPTPTPTGTPTPTATATSTPTGTPFSTVSISGNVPYCSNPSQGPVPDVTLTLTGSASGSTVSDASGDYEFSSVAAGGTYTVTPTKVAQTAGSPGSSINTVDVVATQRHYLLLGIPLSGCRLAAADVNGDNTVNTVDAIAIQRFYLGATLGVANVGKYQFNPASRTYSAISNNQTGQNYDTLIFGDVASGFVYRPEGSSQAEADSKISDGEATVATVVLPDVAVAESRSTFAAVKTSAIEAKSKLVGFQGDFTFDERAVTFESPPVQKAGMTGANWNVSGNVLPGQGPIRTLRISAFSNDFTPLSGSGTLFELRMIRANKAGAQGTPLTWAAPPDQFIFIDADLRTQKPGNAVPGRVSSSAKPVRANSDK